MGEQEKLDNLCINTIRFLSIDAIQQANSGHPGMPMGAAAMGYTLWTRFLKHNPANPLWFDRDRFVLSAGHGSMLLYALLHLTGYDLPLEEVRNFRQWGSLTPGHPERLHTPGVEVTTGPLGQGFANGVGMAMAERHLAARFNREGHEIIDHYTYSICSDGDIMEGVAAEAASLAGHLRLGKLIYLYDANEISLAAATSLTFTEDVPRRFDAYGWHTQVVEDGNDVAAISTAIEAAKQVTDKPSLIMVRTHIGFGSPNMQDTFDVHGKPLGKDEVKATRANLGWPSDEEFFVPEEARKVFHNELSKGKLAEEAWNKRFEVYRQKFPEAAAELLGMMRGEPVEGWRSALPRFRPEDGKVATRSASGKIINALAKQVPALIGGAADLGPSTKTTMKDMGDFEPPALAGTDTQGSAGGGWSWAGRNIHFGVREHAMGSIANGMAAHGGMRPYVSTFLMFSDYLRPTLRLAGLMKLPVIYVFTHDSVAVGEDGPTHQPIEHVASLRAIPELLVLRPGDANETAVAWELAIESKEQPVALILTRQDLPIPDRGEVADAEGVRRGAYILKDCDEETPDLILIASGSEVALALESQQKLAAEGIAVRVVSMPSWELFAAQAEDYRESVLPKRVKARLSIEAGSTLGWERWVGSEGAALGIDRFGTSAPGDQVLHEYGFNVDNVCLHAKRLLKEKVTVK